MDRDILDPCCGGRMFWFDKENPDVLFGDIRDESHVLCDGRKFEIKPDSVLDFRQLPFDDNSFSLVVFDPPHLNKLGETSWMAKKYGVLGENWRDDIKRGFSECFRVLKKDSVLIFKWNETQIKVKELLNLAPVTPLFGHTSSRNGKTIWVTFIKR